MISEASESIFLRRAAMLAVLIGAAGSVGLMLYAGRHNSSKLLLAIFTAWVLAPFAALVWARAASKGWSALTRNALDALSAGVALISWALYGYIALGPARVRTAPVFVVVPPASLVLIALVIAIAAFNSRKRAALLL
jgi:hypothetical protein